MEEHDVKRWAKDHAMTGIGLIVDGVGLRYGWTILIVVGSIFLFLSCILYVCHYTRPWIWRCPLLLAAFAILVIGNLFLMGVWPRRNKAQEPKRTSVITPSRVSPTVLPQKPKEKKEAAKASQSQKNSGSNSTNTQIGAAQAPVAIAPYGIANAAPNSGQQTVNNFGNPQYPPPGVVPTITVCEVPNVASSADYKTFITLTTDTRITRPAFGFYFDGPVSRDGSVEVPGAFSHTIHSRDTNSSTPENTFMFYVPELGDLTETSWYPPSPIKVSITSSNPVHLTHIETASGSASDVNQIRALAEELRFACN